MKRFYNKKGFTLVECLIAIAVFAVMTSMVLVIISNAVQTAKKSNEAETELNSLVEYVENNETVKKYDAADSGVLKMKFGGDTTNYTVTYSNVSGYKNYITCQSCGYTANNSDFMYHIYDTKTYANYVASKGGTDPHRIEKYFCPDASASSYTIDGTTYPIDGSDNANYLKKYWCPKCGAMVSDEKNKLKCYTCGQSEMPYLDDPAHKKGFDYRQDSCSFYCDECGGSNVREKFTVDKIGSDEGLTVNGIYANAIRYGSLDRPSDLAAKTFFAGEDSSNNTPLSKFKVEFSKQTHSPTIPTFYTWKFFDFPSETTTAYITVKLPSGYTIPKIADGVDDEGNPKYKYNITTTQCSATWLPASSTLQITDAYRNATVTFSLVNERSGISFEDDYATFVDEEGNTVDGGLMVYWFKAAEGTNQLEVPRTDLSDSSS